MNLYDSVNNVLKRLDDYPSINGEQVWTRAEVELYLKDGYNAFCRQTKCLLDFFYPENIPPVGNYTARWELEYYQSGMIAHGILSYSGGLWERDYSQASGTGPINHTQPWEAEYLETVFPVAVHPVPEDNVAVDRATHDLHQMEPEFTRFFEETDRSFQTVTGDPWRYSMDRDGMSRLRLVPAGTGNAETYDVQGSYGLLRRQEYIPAVSYWPMDETSGSRVDVRSGYNLTEFGNPGSAAGVYRNAATFTENNYLTVAHNVDLEGSDRDLSVAFWVWVNTALPTIDQIHMVGIYDEWKVFISGFGSYTNYFRFFWLDGVTNPGTWGPQVTPGWHFVLAWRDSTQQTLNLQVDFGTIYTDVSPLRSTVTADAFTVGANDSSAKDFVGGIIDELYVYRGLWTEAQKRAMYEAWTGPLGLWEPSGTWGVLREIPEHFPMGAQYGIPRRLYSDEANTRVEYFRLGKDWDDNGNELPERFLKYVEYYAQAKCLERDGAGQDLKLAGHFMERFDTGVRRMVRRLGENKRAVVGQIGSPGRVPTVPPLARLPWRYGRQIRRGY